MRSWGFVFIFMGWLLLPLLAAGQPALDWHAPSECPSAQEARAEVVRLLQRELTGPFRASVEIVRERAGLMRARISLHSGSVAREQVLRDASCAALTRAAALTVALAFEPQVQENTPPSGPALHAHDAKASTHELTEANKRRRGVARTPRPGRSRKTAPGEAAQPPSAPTPTALAEVRAERSVGSTSLVPTPSDAVSDDPSQRLDASAPFAPTPSAAEAGERPQRSDGSASRPPDPPLSAATSLNTSQGAQQETAQSSQPAPRPLPPLSRSTSLAPTLPAALDPSEGTAARVDHALYLGLGVGLTAGVLPKLAPSYLLAVVAHWSALHCGLRLGFAPGQLGTLPERVGVGGRVALASAGGDIGVALALGRQLKVPLALGVETGFLAATGHEVPERSTRLGAWLAGSLGAGVALTWAGGRFRAALNVEGLLALLRPRFALEAADATDSVFHRPSRLGARGVLTLQLRLP